MIIPGILLALEMSGKYDEELARRLQRREPDAMATLYDRFGRLAYSVILSIVRDAAIRRGSRAGNFFFASGTAPRLSNLAAAPSAPGSSPLPATAPSIMSAPPVRA